MTGCFKVEAQTRLRRPLGGWRFPIGTVFGFPSSRDGLDAFSISVLCHLVGQVDGNAPEATGEVVRRSLVGVPVKAEPLENRPSISAGRVQKHAQTSSVSARRSAEFRSGTFAVPSAVVW